MTTICVDKDGVIAYDGRMTQGNTIVSDDCDKKHKRGGAYFFLAGDVKDMEPFMHDCLEGGSAREYMVSGFMQENGELYEVGGGGDVWICDNIGPMAYGSGADHALTAMDMGADARLAIKMAMKRDCGTGGKIRTFKTR